MVCRDVANYDKLRLITMHAKPPLSYCVRIMRQDNSLHIAESHHPQPMKLVLAHNDRWSLFKQATQTHAGPSAGERRHEMATTVVAGARAVNLKNQPYLPSEVLQS